ncbi:MAG: ATP-binding protein [Gemmatimonadales bacterium]
MSVRARLLVGFFAVTAALAAPTLFATAGLAHLRRLAVEGRSGHAASVARLGRIQGALTELDRLERSFIATGDSTLGRAAASQVASLDLEVRELRAAPAPAVTADLAAAIEDVSVLTREVTGHVHADRKALATMTFTSLLGALDRASTEVAIVADSVDAAALRDVRDAERTSAAARAGTLTGLTIALLFTLVVAGYTTRAMTTPLRRLGMASARIADGEFDIPGDLPYGRADEIGELSVSFRAMTHRLAELDRTKAAFLGIVSHELKTPLNVIKAYAEMIEDELGPRASEKHKALIASVAEQALILSRRVSRLMDISRLEAGSYRLSVETTPIEDLATGLERLFERQARERGIAFAVHVAPSAPFDAVVDVDILRDEILGNLVANAFRFTPAGGSVDVTIEGEKGGIVFTVTDSGPGIPEEHRAYIFDKYYVVDRARAVGSGLGLAIVKEMVRLHGGLVTLDASERGRGARFRVSLPRVSEGASLEVPARCLVGAS